SGGVDDSPDPSVRDEAWFSALFDAHSRALYAYFVRRLPDGGRASDAEDLAAEVLATAWRRRDDVPDGAELPWLYRTAGYVLANRWRKMAARPVAVLPDGPDDVVPGELATADGALRAVLAGLSPGDRRILPLGAWDLLSGDDRGRVL